jgi:hypothetical protein
MPDYKHLHDAGYNVLCYDLRNFGPQRCGERRDYRQRSVGVPRCHRFIATRQGTEGSAPHDAGPF